MEETLHFLELLNGRVAYRKLGNGPKCLVAFHGFAQDGATFVPALTSHHAAHFTCYLIDLPFHGQTKWDDPYFTPSDLNYIIRRLVGKRQFEGVGHSLGGRLWLAMLQDLDPLPDHLHLIAPEGIESLWGEWVEHAPSGLRKKLSGWLKRPTRFLRLASLLREWGVIDQFTLRYLQVQLATETTRKRLFSTWQSLLYFRMGKHRAQHLLAGADFPVEVHLGLRDTIVPASRIAEALEGLENVHLHKLDCGHWDIVQHWQHKLRAPSI